jgi:RNA 3'-terminal phosphate cyclase (ATP)
VLQTILPALLYGDSRSTVRITGGTHNPMAPPVQFLQRAYCPLLRAMGAEVDIDMLRAGFYPAGGGVVRASVAPCARLRPLELVTRGKRLSGYAESIVARVPAGVARRELECIGAAMGWGEPELRECVLPADQGPGNALLITLVYEHVTEVFAAFGEKRVRAEAVAQAVLDEALRYIASDAAVGEHLGDQLMLPMALAGIRAARWRPNWLSTTSRRVWRAVMESSPGTWSSRRSTMPAVPLPRNLQRMMNSEAWAPPVPLYGSLITNFTPHTWETRAST